jgi:hypothetical protein
MPVKAKSADAAVAESNESPRVVEGHGSAHPVNNSVGSDLSPQEYSEKDFDINQKDV